jgi:hypothetical protein
LTFYGKNNILIGKLTKSQFEYEIICVDNRAGDLRLDLTCESGLWLPAVRLDSDPLL